MANTATDYKINPWQSVQVRKFRTPFPGQFYTLSLELKRHYN